MSLSKFESLPNEILIDTFEKYVNAVDILVTFVNQLNSRFDGLFTQCLQLYFDFINCRLDDFRFCIDHLPIYLDKVAGLALSERNTPGQIYTFLQNFPSFALFKHLHSLYLCCSGRAINPYQVQNAILSLSDTNIEILSIKVTDEAIFPSMEKVVSAIFCLTTLKRLSLAFTTNYSHGKLSLSVPLKIEHLTITGLQCDWKVLRSFSQYIPHLKYLNIRLNHPTSDPDYQFSFGIETNVEFPPMPPLRTLILHLGYQTPFDILATYLNYTPGLHRLEIDGPISLLKAHAWEMLIQSSLTQLVYFTLKTSSPHFQELQDVSIYRILTSFQTSFWIEKKYFNIIVTKHELQSRHDKIKDILLGPEELVFHNDISRSPAIEWWAAPIRAANDHIHLMSSIEWLRLSSMLSLPLHQYYFDNVKFLVLYNLNSTLVEWVTTYINCSRITELAIFLSDKEPTVITSLIQCITNIRSLHIDFEQLISHQVSPIQRNGHLTSLDLSNELHTFSEEDIIIVAQIFPCIEHLIINTPDLYNIPLLHDHLPHLRTLCFRIVEPYFDRLKDFEQSFEDNQWKYQTQFLFQREANWIQIWIDQAAFEKSFWQTFASKSLQSVNPSMATKASKKWFPFKCPFLK